MPSGIPAGSTPLPPGITNEQVEELVMRLLEAMRCNPPIECEVTGNPTEQFAYAQGHYFLPVLVCDIPQKLLPEKLEGRVLGEYEGFRYSRTSRQVRLTSLQFTAGMFSPFEIAMRMGWPVLPEHYQQRVPNTEKSND